MTLSECYEEMGADLHEVLRRLKTEERIGKFLKLILKDTNYESLCKALEEKNYEQAFSKYVIIRICQQLYFSDTLFS